MGGSVASNSPPIDGFRKWNPMLGMFGVIWRL